MDATITAALACKRRRRRHVPAQQQKQQQQQLAPSSSPSLGHAAAGTPPQRCRRRRGRRPQAEWHGKRGGGGAAAAVAAATTTLLLFLLPAAHVVAAVALPTALAGGGSGTMTMQQAGAPPGALVQPAVPARYCPDGGSLEGGLCYARCRPGWQPLGCHCWRGVRSYSRGCGARPLVCQAASYRAARLPAPAVTGPGGGRAPFSLVLSADPQLFRVADAARDARGALPNNVRLVRAINRVAELGAWPDEAGGGRVLPPQSLVVLGDMTEYYREDEADAFRALYDPGFPGGGKGWAGRWEDAAKLDGDGAGGSPALNASLPTWLMLGNHEYVNNVNDCLGKFKSLDPNVCARAAVDTTRAVLTPGCDAHTWAGFPRGNVTSFDADSMAYAFDVGRWHFVALHYSPRYAEASLGVRPALGWLAGELAAAAAQGRRSVLLVHAHRELGLAGDPTFARLVSNGGVAAIFYGHVHVRPWGMTGNFPGTAVPMFNCGASWFHAFCYAEFSEDGLRVAAVVHDGGGAQGGAQGGGGAAAAGAGAGAGAAAPAPVDATAPKWFGTSVHALPRGVSPARARPVLLQFTANPASATSSAAAVAGGRWRGGGGAVLLAALATLAPAMLAAL